MNVQPPAKAVQALPLTNEQIAGELDEVADLLEGHGANPFRVRAYRNAAESIRKLEVSIVQLAEDQGVDGLMGLPAIGRSLANTLAHLCGTVVACRCWNVCVARTLPNGSSPRWRTSGPSWPSGFTKNWASKRCPNYQPPPMMADWPAFAEWATSGSERCVRRWPDAFARILLQIPYRLGAGPKPARHRRSKNCWTSTASTVNWPSKASCRAIAPRRFNPTGDAWLPVLHTEREGRHYTALYSNTARAHELGTTHDWVVIYCDDDQRGGSWTAITASYGAVARPPRDSRPRGRVRPGTMRSPPMARNGFHFDQRRRCRAAWPRLARLRRVSGRGHPPLPLKTGLPTTLTEYYFS